MPRPRIYSTDAARQAAYRARKKELAEEKLAEWEAIIDAAWELSDTISEAARRGNSDAAKLNGLKPSQILTILAERFR